MKLVIAEKPSLARAIREAIGADYTVTNAFGHIYEQAEPDDYLPDNVPRTAKGTKKWRIEDLPIIPATWLKNPKPDAKEQIGKIRDLLKVASEVVNAGDPDREGQLLIDEILDELHYCGLVKRVWLQSLTPEAIRSAFARLKPNSEYKPLSDAATARSRADWLVGMNLTRAWTIKNGGLISVGRVQTPTLALIVRRDLEIENFKAQNYFEVHASVQHANGTFTARWKPASTDGPGFDSEGRLIDKARAESIATKAKGQGVIAQYKAEKKSRQAPLPFSLSALQKAASAKHGLGAQQVLDIAQSLYEAQLTSYPRTDCQHLGEDQLSELFRVAQDLATGFKVQVANRKHPAFNNSKVTAHTAIVPTGKDASRLSGPQAKVYDMIARSTVALFMQPEESIAASVVFSCQSENFVATGKRVTAPGWTALYGGQVDEDDEDEPTLPEMKQDDPATGAGAQIKSLKTKPPARFTEGTLIDAMANIHRFITDPAAKAKLKETSGIGTEATRSNIIETLFKRVWLEKRGKQIISTDSGRAVVKALPAQLTDPVTTARWEDHLSSIAAGSLAREKFEAAIAGFIAEQLVLVKTATGAATQQSGNPGGKGGAPTAKCPECGAQARRMESRKKPGKFFWACENRDHGLLADENGKPGKPFGVK
jgi:DNA topoisomerase-3